MMNLEEDVKVAKIAKVREKVSDGNQEYENIDDALEEIPEEEKYGNISDENEEITLPKEEEEE